MTDTTQLTDTRKVHDARITYDVIDGYLAKMSGSACKVYLALCRHANWTTDQTFVKIKTLSELCGIAPGTVSSALAELAELGLLKREERFRPDGSRTSDMLTLLDPPQNNDPTLGYKTDRGVGVSEGGDTNKHYLNNPILSTLSEERQPPAPSGAGTRKRARPADPRRTSPAIRAIQAVKETKALPPKGIWDGLITVLGSDPNLPLLRECFAAWCAKGWNVNNYAWALEWYAQGGPPKAGPPKRNGTGATTLEDRMAILQRLSREEAAPHG